MDKARKAQLGKRLERLRCCKEVMLVSDQTWNAYLMKDGRHGNVCLACSSGSTDKQIGIAVVGCLENFALNPIQTPALRTKCAFFLQLTLTQCGGAGDMCDQLF